MQLPQNRRIRTYPAAYYSERKKLTETLTEAQKKTFEKFKDNTSEISSMTEVTAFTLGFKLGLRLTAEAFIGGYSEQELISE